MSKTQPTKLTKWSTTFHPGQAYTAPECRTISLIGIVDHHEALHARGEFVEGKPICTSPIKSVEGRLVTTQSGSKYLLGAIDPDFREWLRSERPDWDHRNPIKSLMES